MGAEYPLFCSREFTLLNKDSADTQVAKLPVYWVQLQLQHSNKTAESKHL